jgi:hypothetical protein
MTVALGKRHNATGRSDGRLHNKSRQKIAGQFIAHRVEMIRSPAWRALSLTARRILDRLEIEHADHAGRENGSLICTYDDFKRAGIRRNSVSVGLLELIELGFLVVAQQGRMTRADFHVPSKYLLTYLNTKSGGPTDDWSKVADDDDAARRLVVAHSKSLRQGRQDIDSRSKNGPGTVGPFSDPVPGPFLDPGK